MSKKTLSKLDEIEQLLRKAERERRKVAAECSHQSEKGKLKLNALHNGEFQCKLCKERFSMDIIDRTQIEKSVDILNNAIQQIRCFSDPTENEQVIRRLGEMAFNLKEVSSLYERIVESSTRGNKHKNKNKHKNEDDFGSWGGGISFIGGGKRR